MTKKSFIFKTILFFFTIIVVGLNIYTFFFLYERKNDEQEVSDIMMEIDKSKIEIEVKNGVTPASSDEEKTEKKINQEVNVQKLQEINKDTKGWIKVDGTSIDYPFVQSTDNQYYLTHSFKKEKNKSGWIFLDYRNDINNLNKNTIFYGHNRLTGTMFGTLKNLLTVEYQRKDTHYIYIETTMYKYIFEVFSTYTINKESYYIQTDFTNDEEYLEFLTTIKKRSTYSYDVELSSTDKILTLSTCSKDNDRLAVHAKLISKKEKGHE